MANIKAIELKGIVHNASKIGMQDGASEDLINMRFNDGSWRPVGEPIPLGLDLSGQTYDDFYIHKNKYTNIIAYKSGERRLYWIASNKVSDFTSSLHMLEERVCILENVGEDFTITQNGNLISIVDGEGTFEYFLFKQTQINIYNSIAMLTENRQTESCSLLEMRISTYIYQTTQSEKKATKVM